ncbi:spike base protein, RCAP_Rcc01079 family [Sphingobium lignivorans]|uniref:Uncharacterized protein n=1 Tax=Sphingobium lignivorans TaxID=2735886 RepID=A0ABR6NJI8_9SPHN|nr:hypothetical protein [Sphingobium lignivorans]MBB5987445.1 hypothetical protein [Sphingobium lignivorans]
MTDLFASHLDSPTAPARRAFTIVPSDSAPIDPLPKAVRFNGAGTVTFRAVDSTADETWDVSAGEIVDVRMLYIRQTGTEIVSPGSHPTGISGIA